MKKLLITLIPLLLLNQLEFVNKEFDQKNLNPISNYVRKTSRYGELG